MATLGYNLSQVSGFIVRTPTQRTRHLLRLPMCLGLLWLTGCKQDEPNKAPVVPIVPEEVPYNGLARLTASEWQRALIQLLDVEIDTKPMLPEDARTPFDNDVDHQHMTRAFVEGVDLAAQDAADKFVDEGKLITFACQPASSLDRDCYARLATKLVRLGWRGQGTEADVELLIDKALDIADEASANDGAKYLVRAVLTDPAFTYRLEIGRPRPDGLIELTDHEIATRMAFELWGLPPDEALLVRADQGGLNQVSTRRALAKEMWADTRTIEQLERFHAQWLGYEVLPLTSITNDFRTEANAMVTRVNYDELAPWHELLLLDETYLTPRAAVHYGHISESEMDDAIEGWTPIDPLGEGRKGILSTGAFLSGVYSPVDTSPTRRGQHIRDRFLCAPLPPPPEDANADLNSNVNGECKPERFAAHTQDPACAACHDLMDPIGFGLENFDRTGLYKAFDTLHPDDEILWDCPIDGQGTVPNVGDFQGPGGLAELLVNEAATETCFVEHFARYSLGRDLRDEDSATLAHLTQSLSKNGRFQELMFGRITDPRYHLRRPR